MEYQELIYEVRDKVAVLTLNRPKSLNSFNRNLKYELEDAIGRIEKDETIWGLIITGSGRAFSSGTDISDFPSTVEQARKITDFSQRLFDRVENLEKPVIAAVNGYALGGGLELALACDIRVASEKAKLGFPEVKICAIPCYGGTIRLARLAGLGKAKEMIFTGDMITAAQAKELGIVNHVTEPGAELEKAMEIMGKILKNAPMAVSYAKQCINRGAASGLEEALALERNLVSMLVPTHDIGEGTRAFLEKREPVFLNK